MVKSLSELIEITALLCLLFLKVSEVTFSKKEKVSPHEQLYEQIEQTQVTSSPWLKMSPEFWSKIDSTEDKFYVNIARKRYKKGIE